MGYTEGDGSLFGVDKSGVSRHITNIYKDGELQQEATIAKIATVVNRTLETGT